MGDKQEFERRTGIEDTHIFDAALTPELIYELYAVRWQALVLHFSTDEVLSNSYRNNQGCLNVRGSR